MESHCEINVSKDGTHLFATSPRSLTTIAQAQALYNILSEKFPKSEGYLLTVSHYNIVGRQINF